MRKFSALLGFVSLLILSSCDFTFISSSSSSHSTDSSQDSSSSSSQISDSSTTSSSITIEPNVERDQEYLDFFATTSTVSFDLVIPKANLKQVEIDGVSNSGATENYHEASLTIKVNNGQETKTYQFDRVGVRMKGNTSRTNFVNDQGHIYALTNYKISFKKFEKDQRFLNMEKIDLKWNRNSDDTNVRQVYAHKMFQHYLYMSPGATLATFSIKQTESGNELSTTKMGVYNVLECMDETFIDHYYSDDDAKGDLYKVTYKGTGKANFTTDNAVYKDGDTYVAYTRDMRNSAKIGVEDPDIGYAPTYDLKTNKKKSNSALLANVIGVINNLSSYKTSQAKQAIDQIIDIPLFLKYEAVAFFIGNPDDLRNLYNNTYLYFLPSTGKMMIMPYDLDRIFGAHGTWDPTGNSMTQVSPYSTKAYGDNGNNQENPIYNATVMKNYAHPDYLALYASYLDEIINGPWMNYNHFLDMYNNYKDNYQDLMDTSNSLATYPFSLTANSGERNWTMSNYLTTKKTNALSLMS